MFCLLVSLGPLSAAVVSNPGGTEDDLGAALSLPGDVTEEVGNVSLSAWNVLDSNSLYFRRTITFEGSDGYSAISTDFGGNNTVNTDVRSVNLVRDFGNFGPVVDNNSAFTSGGTNTTAWGNTGGGGTFTFDEGVQGVAFFANRLQGNLTVTLYSDAAKTSTIGSPYTLSNAAGFSYFGFLDDDQDIRAVSFVSDSGIYGLDDFSFAVAVPEPGTFNMLLISTALVSIVRRKRMED